MTRINRIWTYASDLDGFGGAALRVGSFLLAAYFAVSLIQ